MSQLSRDPKAGERAYYRALGDAGLAHARAKPWSDGDCGRYLADLGVVLHLLGSEPKRVLDFGCGTGWTSLFLARAGHRVTGVDIAPEAIAAAQSLAASEGLANVGFVVADYEHWQHEGSFDAVLFYDALHHAEDERAALSAAHRSLRSGGMLIAIEPGEGHSASAEARHAVETFGVHEKSMPPGHVWALAREIGFTRRVALPLPREAMKTIYRHDYLRAGTPSWREKLWSVFRLLTKFTRADRAGLLLLWK